MLRYYFFSFTLLLCHLPLSAEQPLPKKLTHWVVLHDNSLLTGRVTRIGSDEIHLTNKDETIALKRSDVRSVLLVPPVDPILARKKRDALLNPNTEVKLPYDSLTLINGDGVRGRISQYSDGRFRIFLCDDRGELLSSEATVLTRQSVRVIHLKDR